MPIHTLAGKRASKAVRRSELSRAAFAVLVDVGIRHTTVEKIAERGGVSKGVVLHHFEDKDALFEVVMRRVNTLLRDGLIELLRHVETPVERLAAVIVANFSGPIFQQEVCHAWINLPSDVPYNRQSRRIQNVIDARVRSNLLVALRGLPLEYDLDSVVSQLAISMDGLWLQASLHSRPVSSRQGIDAMVVAVTRLGGLDKATSEELRSAVTKMEGIASIVLTSRAFLEKAGTTLK